MTDWSDVRRDEGGDWVTKTGRALCPDMVDNFNREYPYAEWWRAAEFCTAVVKAIRDEAEAEERNREAALREKVDALCHMPASRSRAEKIIHTVREYDA